MGLMQALSHVGYPLPPDSGRLKVMHLLVLHHMSDGVIVTYSIFYTDFILPVINFTPASITLRVWCLQAHTEAGIFPPLYP